MKYYSKILLPPFSLGMPSWNCAGPRTPKPGPPSSSSSTCFCRTSTRPSSAKCPSTSPSDWRRPGTNPSCTKRPPPQHRWEPRGSMRHGRTLMLSPRSPSSPRRATTTAGGTIPWARGAAELTAFIPTKSAATAKWQRPRMTAKVAKWARRPMGAFPMDVHPLSRLVGLRRVDSTLPAL